MACDKLRQKFEILKVLDSHDYFKYYYKFIDDSYEYHSLRLNLN